MISDLQPGQTIASHYKLDKQLNVTGSHETWVAAHLQTGERLCLRIVPANVTEDAYNNLTRHLESVRGLLHENIIVSSGWVNEAGLRFLTERYISTTQPLDLSSPDAWQHLKALINTLQYAHSLGIVHGHLSPGNLLIRDGSTLLVTGFSLPANFSAASDYLSPQQLAQSIPLEGFTEDSSDVSDDVYALGRLLYRVLTGDDWQNSDTSVAATPLKKPLSAELIRLLDQMLSHASFDRVIDFDELTAALDHYYDGDQSGIAPIAFVRQPLENPTTARAEAPVASSGPAGRPNRGLSVRTVVSAGGGLLLLAVVLFLILPTTSNVTSTRDEPARENTPSRSQPAASTPADEIVVTLTPVELARQAFVEEESNSLAKEILRLQIELEDISVNLWAEADFELASQKLEAADTHFRDDELETALTAYQAVKRDLIAIGERIPSTLADQTLIGVAALENGDALAAMRAFTIATIIAPDDAALANQLMRAENLEDVISLTNQAEILERAGDLDAALKLAKDAAALDSKWPPTSAVNQRLKKMILLRNFQLAMSDGFSGISSRNYEKARAGFLSAKKILPNSMEPADGLAQVEQAENNDRITQLQTKAEQHLESGDWSSAIDVYQLALSITPTLEFAINGLAYAQDRVALQQSIEKYLADPTLLQSDEDLALASSALRDASRLSDQSTMLKSQINTLAKLISTARVEVPVQLSSDGETDVTVRKHAALGTFASETVYLIPGRYTIVGERRGYRDVREDLIILPGRPNPTVTIKSTEKVL